MICRICANGENNTSYNVKEMMYGMDEEFLYFECSRCGCLQIGTFPNDISKYYADDYYSLAKNLERPKKPSYLLGLYVVRTLPSVVNRAIFNDFFPGRLLRALIRHIDMNMYILEILKRADIKLNTELLDVGCGAGLILYYLRELGYHNVVGIDPFIKEDITYSNGLKIFKKNPSDFVNSGFSGFDIIMFNHSFEHIKDQHIALRTCSRILRSGGVIIINTPTVSSYAWRHYKEKWVSLDAPRHFFLHSVDSMKLLAKQTGFRVFDIIYDSTEFQFWGSEQYRKNINLQAENSYQRSHSTSMFTRTDILSYRRMARNLNACLSGDTAAFLVKKDR